MGTTFTVSGSTTGGALIGSLYHDSVVNAIYYSKWLGLTVGNRELFPKRQQAGDSASRWVVRRGTGSPEVFTEGQIAPAADVQKYSLAAVSWTYCRSVLRISGHAIDAMQSGISGTSNILDTEIRAAAEDVSDLLCTSFLGSTYGLENAISATGSYAGISRGAVSWFESQVTSVGGALTTASMMTMLQNLLDSPRGGFSEGGAILMSPTQYKALYNLGGNAGIKSLPANDVAAGFLNQTFAGHPCVAIPDLSSSIMVFLDTKPGMNEVTVIRPMSAKTLAPSADDELVQISTGAALIVRDPMRSGKLTTIS